MNPFKRYTSRMEYRLFIKKIEMIKKELSVVKSLTLSSKKRIISLKGLLKGIKVTERDLQETKTLFYYSV